MNRTLPELPDARPLLLKALLTAGRKPRPESAIPPLAVSVSGVRADAALLDRYREVCGFAGGDTLPITYPQVLASALHLWLMTQPEFPFPLLGLVHLRNRIEQQRPLPASGSYEVRASVGAPQVVAQGVTFGLITEFIDASGELLYSAVTTPLSRMKTGVPKAKRAAEAADARLSAYKLIDVPADTGRRYAAVSQDYNPIHLYPLTARLFGFSRAIAHGMWSAAHCAALLQSELGREPLALEVQYRAPLLLPSRAVLKHAAASQGQQFQLLATDSDRIYLSGVLR